MNASATSAPTTDPVCGMTIDASTAAASTIFDGETISFCSDSCKTKFDAAPAQYLASAEGTSCCGPACCSK